MQILLVDRHLPPAQASITRGEKVIRGKKCLFRMRVNSRETVDSLREHRKGVSAVRVHGETHGRLSRWVQSSCSTGFSRH